MSALSQPVLLPPKHLANRPSAYSKSTMMRRPLVDRAVHDSGHTADGRAAAAPAAAAAARAGDYASTDESRPPPSPMTLRPGRRVLRMLGRARWRPRSPCRQAASRR
eukprot:scaffold27096_cov62-Phaeocystis_antarctica.AAC.2